MIIFNKSISKLSLAILIGASLTACSEQKDEVVNKTGSVNESMEQTTSVNSDEAFQQDVHYRILDNPFMADNNHVTEFFWYGCPACKATEPLIDKLHSNAALTVEVRASLSNEKWIFDALVFEAFKHFNVLEKAHKKYFEVRQNGSLTDQASFEVFLTELEIDPIEFRTFISSDEVKATLDASYKLETQVEGTGVPMLIVAGKYALLNRGFENVDEMEKAIEWLSKK